MFLAFQRNLVINAQLSQAATDIFGGIHVRIPVFKRLRRQIDRSQSAEPCNANTCRKPGCLHLKK